MGCAFCFFMASIMVLNSTSFSLDTSPSVAFVSAVVVVNGSAGSVVVVGVVNVVGIADVGTVSAGLGFVTGAVVVATGDPLVDMLQIVQQEVNAKAHLLMAKTKLCLFNSNSV